jgi:hypothetical protein
VIADSPLLILPMAKVLTKINAEASNESDAPIIPITAADAKISKELDILIITLIYHTGSVQNCSGTDGEFAVEAKPMMTSAGAIRTNDITIIRVFISADIVYTRLNSPESTYKPVSESGPPRKNVNQKQSIYIIEIQLNYSTFFSLA